MATEEFANPVQGYADGRMRAPAAERSVGDLFKQLTADTGDLLRQEISLVTAEIRQTAATFARDGAEVATALALAMAGLMALVAFFIAGLGSLLDDRYWLSALIVAVVLLGIGGVLARHAVADIKRRLSTPSAALETVRQDVRWAERAAHEFQYQILKPPARN
jgi:uncharacterized membrane protein YqjE